jgi:hypothetical protein
MYRHHRLPFARALSLVGIPRCSWRRMVSLTSLIGAPAQAATAGMPSALSTTIYGSSLHIDQTRPRPDQRVVDRR